MSGKAGTSATSLELGGSSGKPQLVAYTKGVGVSGLLALSSLGVDVSRDDARASEGPASPLVSPRVVTSDEVASADAPSSEAHDAQNAIGRQKRRLTR